MTQYLNYVEVKIYRQRLYSISVYCKESISELEIQLVISENLKILTTLINKIKQRV